VEFPLGRFIVVTGVSGSGKSTLVNDILYRSLAKEVYGSHEARGRMARSRASRTSIRSSASINRRSGARRARIRPLHRVVFAIREYYALLPESRERGYKPGRSAST